MTGATVLPAPAARVQGWLTAFHADPPLHTSFPLDLSNGHSVPGIHVICPCCNTIVATSLVHGRVTRPLPHVVAVEATGWCAACDRLTHATCRFRATHDETLIEWLDADGRWQVRACRAPTARERMLQVAKRWITRLGLATPSARH